MTRPIRALIDTYALEKNLSLLRAKSGNRFLWGVVKANAYGHGLIGLLPTFDNWVDGLALLDPKEGVDIRKAGWAKAVLLIEGIFADSDIEMADEYGFETVIHNERQIEWLEKHASRALEVQYRYEPFGLQTGGDSSSFVPPE